MKKYDLAIIGSGPIGLFATSFAQLHGFNTVTFEALEKIGGQPTYLYPNKQIKDIPAYPKITGDNLIKNLNDQIETKNIISNYRVQKINKSDQNGFIIDNDYYVKSIVLATGLGAFQPKPLPLEIPSTLEQNIHYFLPNPQDFKNKQIAVLGGGDSALDWALELSPRNKVTLIHRRTSFRGLESNVTTLSNSKNVSFFTPFLPSKIQPTSSNKIQLTLKEVGNNNLIEKEFDDLLVAYGFKSNNTQLRKWGLQLSHGLIEVNNFMETNIQGIYAVGDAITYPGRAPMIGIGFGEVQIAISKIMETLFPEKKMTLHSTGL
ncbi:NAD(P)/FAD-dependent oxidoreductase [Lactobacillus sp. PV012]|uniref:NAD(P)/FAD-dependent oxidoreductase n=1 Tax=Lactobacillus sp. PV012 TaxID=2594494 RepID=UPI00223EAF26|nr:NAD(P)/FAD-dependent oxidoreductase [Lactobacillus sp. PV012]QNQ81932.1 NAD(P)/FAD-dependent oxidoreductase [Lactobacillus sp. PV012]